MGNGIGKGCHCLAGARQISRSQHDIAVVLSNPLDEGLGHSFCYVRPDPPKLSSFSSNSEEEESFATTTFRSISGASVSANTSTPLSTSLVDLGGSSAVDRAASFASSTSFASIPLQPIPRCSTSGLTLASGPIERGFMSGPMERGFVSGPLDRGVYSGPIEEGRDTRTKDGRGYRSRVKSKKRSLINIFKKVISSTISRGHKSIVAPVKGSVNVKEPNLDKKNGNVSVSCGDTSSSTYLKDGDGEEESEYFMERENLQWAQGKAGEDRVQVVISEEHGWVFVGIYDGFNGPDATEYLVSNLYSAVHRELEDLVWNDKLWPSAATSSNPAAEGRNQSERMNFDEEDDTLGKREMEMDSNSKRKHNSNSKNRSKGLGKRCEESQSRWSFEGDVERVELERKLKRQFVRWGADGAAGTDHSDVLKALSDALRKTEDAYLETADRMLGKNPELALMGSCVLVMLMRGEDVYLMNVGDSRAVLAREAELDRGPRKVHQDLKRINEEILSNHNLFGGCGGLSNLISLQLTTDHSTYVEEEAQRIRSDHPDDSSAIMNDRVKGYLKVTRAFGAGFLKQPKWNDALLEMFRINYVGTSPYITCFPSVYHYALGPMDRFLILSSDGLYQYFTNEEVVSQVEYFIASFPEGDPAQHLIEEVLFRAAKKAGIDFHELLDIPQGERRRYHDDVSVIIISLEGRIWRSSM